MPSCCSSNCTCHTGQSSSHGAKLLLWKSERGAYCVVYDYIGSQLFGMFILQNKQCWPVLTAIGNRHVNTWCSNINFSLFSLTSSFNFRCILERPNVLEEWPEPEFRCGGVQSAGHELLYSTGTGLLSHCQRWFRSESAHCCRQQQCLWFLSISRSMKRYLHCQGE